MNLYSVPTKQLVDELLHRAKFSKAYDYEINLNKDYRINDNYTIKIKEVK